VVGGGARWCGLICGAEGNGGRYVVGGRGKLPKGGRRGLRTISSGGARGVVQAVEYYVRELLQLFGGRFE